MNIVIAGVILWLLCCLWDHRKQKREGKLFRERRQDDGE
jgi:heme/copper-type cytochrome/quinol oxidase subunit 2